ncbi:MAG TPA: hypothetical protein DCE42_07375 [Myxococcales bacterium]|nr:hypothetical protein [Myxococcales bacterium]
MRPIIACVPSKSTLSHSEKSPPILAISNLLCSLLGLLSFFTLVVFPSSNAMAAVSCGTLYQQKKYAEAGDCFWKQAVKLGPGQKLKLQEKYEKGRRLRNAARCYAKAAKSLLGTLIPKGGTNKDLKMTKKNAQTFTRAAYFRERGVAMLQVYREEKLYEDPQVFQRTWELERTWSRKIGYSRVTIQTKRVDAKLCVEGFRTKICREGMSWRGRLRPGIYKVEVGYPGLPAVFRRRTFLLRPRSKRVLPFQPPKRTRSMLSLKSQPEKSRIYINGHLVGTTPLRLIVPSGRHSIELRKGCYLRQAQAVAAPANKKTQLSLRLRRDPYFLKWRRDVKKQKDDRFWGYIFTGIGGAFVGGGIVLSVVANDTLDKAQEAYFLSTESPESLANFKKLANEYNGLHLVRILSFVAGIGVLGFGGWRLVATSFRVKRTPCEELERNDRFRAPKWKTNKEGVRIVDDNVLIEPPSKRP